MNKKLVSLIGIVLGVVVIVMGILVMAGVFGGDASGAGTSPYNYDSGYASFGADFYTYVSNNAAEAASAARTVASNLVRIADLLKNALGILTIAFGAFMCCFFALKFVGCIEKATVHAAPAPAVHDDAANQPVYSAAEPIVNVASDAADEPPAEEIPAAVEEVAEEIPAAFAQAEETVTEE